MKAALLALLSRKFIISFVAVIAILFFLPIQPEQKLNYVTAIIGIYATANAAQKIGTGYPQTTRTEKTSTPEGATTETTESKPVAEPPPSG